MGREGHRRYFLNVTTVPRGGPNNSLGTNAISEPLALEKRDPSVLQDAVYDDAKSPQGRALDSKQKLTSTHSTFIVPLCADTA